MATSKAQRVGIWVIAGAMILGTIAGFAAMILTPTNQAADQARQQAEYAKMLKEYEEEQKKAREANRPLDGYAAAPFDSASVTELTSEVLVEGTGTEVANNSVIKANYFGWTSDGQIFDSTNKNGTTTPAEFTLVKPEESKDGSGVISGWVDGLKGKKVGSTIKITIPADQAYGSTDDGSGRPVGPLQFVVEIKEIVKSE